MHPEPLPTPGSLVSVRAVPGLPTPPPPHHHLFTAIHVWSLDHTSGVRPHARFCFFISSFLSRTSPCAPCAGLRDRSSVDYMFQASLFCSYIQQFASLHHSNGVSGGPRVPGQSWKGLVYYYVTITLMKETTAFALARAGREIWPPVSGRSNGVCILTTAFC